MDTGDRLGKRLLEARYESEAWRPQLFRLAVAEDRRALSTLLDEVPGLQVYDALEEQLIDLIRTRNPSERISDPAARERVRLYLGETPPEEYGVWVYYSWAARLVHLLDEAEFVELRTNRNKYKLTPEEQARLATKRVGVIGLSVGQTVATTMALERSVGEIRLADFDRLDLSNLNRIRSSVHNLGVSKVLITARDIAEIDPFLKVVLYPVGVHDDNLSAFLLRGGKLDVLIDECDSIDIKLKLRVTARLHKIPVLMETSDRALIDVERFDLEPARPIFHGLVGNIEPERIANLSTEEKIPYVLKIIGEGTMSSRMVTSMIEIESTIKTWPQLGSCVVYGGGAAADIVRRMNLGQMNYSGRFIADIESIVPNDPAPDGPVELPHVPAWTAEAMERAADRGTHGRPAALAWSTEQARELVELAARAPSGGNTQPWRWLLRGGRLFLFHERARSESLADFRAMGGVAALGAAAESLRLAAHARGLELAQQVFPSADEPDLAAVFERLAGPGPDALPHWHDELAGALGARNTNRKASPREPLDLAHHDALRDATCSISGARLQFVAGDADLAEIADLIGIGDQQRIIDDRLNREMFREVRWTPEEAEATRDGITIDSLELSAADRAGLSMCRRQDALPLLRALGGGKGLRKSAAKAIASASAVGLLTMPRIGAEQFFRGGQALQRMWLVAHALGLAIYPMSTLPYLFLRVRHGGEGLSEAAVAALAEARPRFTRLFPGEPEQAEVLLFRVSRAEALTQSSLRRPVAEILHVSGS
ncbi:Rv1355c family protein [Nannocystis bainbridge]|uniref:Rv1355c family protein n=1 Tax=Nannocystis bainbridge TaxID=2995303 RepID=A0ABT5DXW6_9BACT|nr:Rv1355c family protein [Nannocystis bainbridge]MDC0718469.1 Rv1355c family protein [Nannocystis bainbridge]